MKNKLKLPKPLPQPLNGRDHGRLGTCPHGAGPLDHCSTCDKTWLTPAPWDIAIITDILAENAEWSDKPNEHLQADAALITAAPELLKQLKALVVQIETSGHLVVPPNVVKTIATAEGR